jgi:TonB family protein
MDLPRTKLLVILAAGQLISSSPLKAQAYYDYAGTYAIDAKGDRHSYKDYPRHRPPWVDDQIKTFAPIYSYSDRAAHRQGHGFFQIAIDIKTGCAASVIVARSTGVKTLDDSAVAALRKWCWKPGKWKEVDVPVTFTMGPKRPMPAGAVRVPSRW